MSALSDYERCHLKASKSTISDIAGIDKQKIQELCLALSQRDGDMRKQAKALLECLGRSGWQWPGFAREAVSEADYKEMAQAIVGRIERLAHALHRRRQLMDVSDRCPYWQLKVGSNPNTPDECRRLDGVTKHFSDPFWKVHLPPCKFPGGACQVFALSERDLVRRGYDIPARAD